MSIVRGSIVPEGTPDDHVFRVPVFTTVGIRAKHKLTGREFDKLCEEVRREELSTNLLKFPDGPQYDIMLYLVATTR